MPGDDCIANLKQEMGARFLYGLHLARIFHEYATNHSVAGMITEFIDFMRKDSLYPARRLPNANLFWHIRNAHAPFNL